MNTNPQVIDELRSMFKSGATPSRLIHHIAERHPDEARYFGLIQDYFQEAFGVPIARGLNPIDRYEQFDTRYFYLNEQLIHEMVEKKGEWDKEGNSDAGTWLDNLSASDDAARFREVESTPLSEMKESWDKLTPKEQRFIVRSLATAQYLNESMKILARLAESLQQQVVELQAAPAGVSGE